MTIEQSIYVAVIAAWVVNALMKQMSSFWLYALISLPGTITHEVAHYAAGMVTGASPVSFSIWPRKEGSYWVFGTVGFSNINNFNALPASMAPLLILLFPWALTEYVDFNVLAWYEVIGLLFLTALICHSAIPSIQDFKVLLSKPIGLVLWVVFLYWALHDQLPNMQLN